MVASNKLGNNLKCHAIGVRLQGKNSMQLFVCNERQPVIQTEAEIGCLLFLVERGSGCFTMNYQKCSLILRHQSSIQYDKYYFDSLTTPNLHLIQIVRSQCKVVKLGVSLDQLAHSSTFFRTITVCTLIDYSSLGKCL